jgi:hypothetical protein
MKKYFPLRYHLIYQVDIPDKSFLVNNVEYDVPCVFQIWDLRDNNRIVEDKIIPKNFQFVNKQNADISFRRIGVYAGKIMIDIDKSIQSHYFIKFTNDKTINENIEKLKSIKFDFNNTVGPKSISKQELIKKFNKYL